MSGVILVAPREATWARRAEALLTGAHLHVARAQDIGITGFLLLSGGVRAILVDARCTGRTWLAQHERLKLLSPRTRVLVIGESPADLVAGVIAWPDDPSAALALVGGPA